LSSSTAITAQPTVMSTRAHQSAARAARAASAAASPAALASRWNGRPLCSVGSGQGRAQCIFTQLPCHGARAHTSVLQPRTYSVSGSPDDTVSLARGALCTQRVPNSPSLAPWGARQAHTSARTAAALRRQGAQQVVELVAEANERAAHGVARGREQLAQVREAAPQRRHQRLQRPAAVALATPLRRPPGRAKCGPRLTSGPHLSSVHVE